MDGVVSPVLLEPLALEQQVTMRVRDPYIEALWMDVLQETKPKNRCESDDFQLVNSGARPEEPDGKGG